MTRATSFVVGLACIAAPAPAQDCSNTGVGLRPLDDLRSHDYLGSQGGLYPGGSNRCPEDHEDDGVAIAQTIEPLGADGLPAADGKIGVASIGLSLCRQPFDAFLDLVSGDPDLASSLVFVNGAAPNMEADVIADPTVPYWTSWVPQLVADAGLDVRQVQVVWLLTSVRDQTEPFPDHALTLTDLFVAIVQNVKAVFPNARICYVSSVNYMGYATASPSDEPYYFEQGFAQKWLIERQIGDDPLLEWDAAAGTVLAPWLAWGPYLWTDGETPRSDGFRWLCSDVEPDGAHPNRKGEEKDAALLAHFLKSDLTATPWFLADGAGASGHPADVELVGDGTPGSDGEPRISVSELPTVPTAASLDLQASHAIADGSGWFLLAFAQLEDPLPFAGGSLYLAPALVLPVAFDADGSGAVGVGAIPDDPAYADLVAYVQLVCLDPLGLDGKLALSSALQLRLGD